MGSGSSMQSRFTETDHLYEDYESKEDFKDDDDPTSKYSCVYTPYNIDTSFSLEEKKEYEYYNYPVWIAINTVIKTILVIRDDFQSKVKDTGDLGDLVEIMTKIVMNIDGIYNIRYRTYEHSKIHIAEEAKVARVKLLLEQYYGQSSVIIIRVDDKEIINLDKFTYDIFQFEKVGNYLYIFVGNIRYPYDTSLY